MGIEIPSELGGAESSFTSAILTIEELAKVDPSVSVMCDVHNTLVNTVVRKYGTKEQQEKHLPLLAQSKVGSIYRHNHERANSLRAARIILSLGSCVRIRRLRATDEGEERGKPLGYQRLKNVDHELIRGRYLPHFCQRTPPRSARGSRAHLPSVAVQVDPSKGYKGITCFLATRDMGIQIAKKEEKLGIRASSTCSLNFDDLKVPEENVIGGEGKGYKVSPYSCSRV